MIDRRALVSRHDPTLAALDPYSPMSVGNGEFAFTADATGLQTFLPAGEGTTPLCTMSQWGWHSYPLAPGEKRDRAGLRLQQFDAGGRRVGYMTDPAGQEALFAALRVNPHRLNLGRLGFVSAELRRGSLGTGLDGYAEPEPARISGVRQTLDLWRGTILSDFLLDGAPVSVRTAVHPVEDVLSFRAESPALADGGLAVRLSFPYGSHLPDASDWASPDSHRTEETALPDADGQTLLLRRTLDADSYFVVLRVGPGASARRTGPHEFLLRAEGPVLEGSLRFCATEPAGAPPAWEEVRSAAETHWAGFWSSGAAVELAGSADPRALELERRIVLSQYLTAIQCAGSLPPQETGLVCNSWYGKFHLEMHYWHAAHFALWRRPRLLERSLGWYRSILESAKRRAASQGYRGVRWPKMTDPGGEDSPSPIGPLLCWQEPHPIMYAELLRRAGADRSVLEPLAELVAETAEFMADYARLDESSGRYVLGPPLIPAQESHKPTETLNPTFELEYWRWGLETALKWRDLFGPAGVSDAGAERWRRVLYRLAAPASAPVRGGGRAYLAHEACPDTYEKFAVDHPSMLLALGMLPGATLSRAAMSASYDAVLESWDFVSSWGWDFPALAMTAARLGRRTDAVDALLMETPKNTYRPNGHNAQLAGAAGPAGSPFLWTTKLPLYLPGNGALLLAVALMAGGWDGDGGGPAPGFPADGSWKVAVEGLGRLP